MIFIFAAAVYGIFKCRFWAYWKWVVYAMVWSTIGTLLFPSYGTLQDPRGSGFLTRYVMAATNDGPGMAIYAIVMLIVLYGLMIFLLSKAGKVAQVHKAAIADDPALEYEGEQVDQMRKVIETVGLIVGFAVWYVAGAMILQLGGPAAPVAAVADSGDLTTAGPVGHVPDQIALDLNAAAISVTESAPKKIDDVTTLTGASSEGRTFTYHYTIGQRKTASDAVFLARMGAVVIPKACGNPQMRKDITTNGVTYEYLYSFPGRRDPLSMKVDSVTCEKN